jgi:hypothetical protein
MNNEIKNYYSNKINIDYANNIRNICKNDKVFNKFIKLCFRHDISFINITKDNIYEILSIDKLLQICNNLKKTKVLKLGNYIINSSNLNDENELINNIQMEFKNLKKDIYDINRIFNILNDYKKNENIFKEYCNINLNNYDIFIPEKKLKYTEKNDIISIDSNILNTNNSENSNNSNNNLLKIKRYFINKKNPFIAEYTNENI